MNCVCPHPSHVEALHCTTPEHLTLIGNSVISDAIGSNEVVSVSPNTTLLLSIKKGKFNYKDRDSHRGKKI